MKKLMVALCLLTFASIALANPIKNITFFGDSLSDSGNLYNYIKFIPKSPPYFEGRFSNGPTWAEIVGKYYNSKYCITSDNYAVGGATVLSQEPWDGTLPRTFGEEIDVYLTHTSNSDKSSNLYTIWIGANDYLDNELDNADTLTTNVVNQITKNINVLIDKGAQHFLVLGLPDLSENPFARASNLADRLRQLTMQHNDKLAAAIAKIKSQHPKIDITYQSTQELFVDVLKNPNKYRIKDTVHACWDGGYFLRKEDVQFSLHYRFSAHAADNMTQAIMHSPTLQQAYMVSNLQQSGEDSCSNPDEYMFWDHLHPTEKMHQIFADFMKPKMAKSLNLS